VTDLDFPDDFFIILAIEWRPSTQQYVENHPDGPDIAFFIVPSIGLGFIGGIQNFRGYVIGSTEGLSKLCRLAILRDETC